jgi:hypothetical protein
MATKSGAQHRLTSRTVLVLVLSALVGGVAAGGTGIAHRATGPAAPTATSLANSTVTPSTPLPSDLLPDQIRSPSPDGRSTFEPPTPAQTGSPGPASPAPVEPIRPATEPAASPGGMGGSDPLATQPNAKTTAPTQATGRRPESYQRSLVYSGLLGLAIAAIGLSMVARRRRLW